MKKSRFSEEQMVKILREADRAPVPEVAKRHSISDQPRRSTGVNPWRVTPSHSAGSDRHSVRR